MVIVFRLMFGAMVFADIVFVIIAAELSALIRRGGKESEVNDGN